MKNKRQRLYTTGLIAGILIACFIIGWFIYNKPKDSNNVTLSLPTAFPNIEFQFAIGGDGSAEEYSLSEPMAVDIGDNGDIYVADTLNSLIKVFDKKGNFKIKFGQQQFYLPVDIAVNNENIFVVDSKNSRIQVFDLNGGFKRTLAGPEIGKKIGAWIPAAIDITENGDIYATDVFSQRVIVFDYNGKVKNYFGVPGSGNGQLLYPNGIVVGGMGDIYVSDSNNTRIQVFDPRGKFINELNNNGEKLGFFMPRGIAAGEDNLFFVADSFSHGLKIFKAVNDKVTDTAAIGSRGVEDGEMNFPNDVAVNHDVLCVADRANDRILVYQISDW